MNKPVVKTTQHLGIHEALEYVAEKYGLGLCDDYDWSSGITAKGRLWWYLYYNKLTGHQGNIVEIPFAKLFMGEHGEEITPLPTTLRDFVHSVIIEFDLTGENKNTLFRMDW